MKQITFYLDFISPYAYLAFEKLPEALQGLSYAVDYRPVLFAGLLRHHGQLGPAEIASKRQWTYKQVLWLGRTHGVPIELPSAHPFNPLGLLRLALACGNQGQANRHVCETLFRHVWQGGADAADPQRLAEVATRLQPQRDPAGADVKSELKANTDAAVAGGVFGVPTLEAEGQRFWGFDSLPMLRAFLDADPWFSGSQAASACHLPTGVSRPARG